MEDNMKSSEMQQLATQQWVQLINQKREEKVWTGWFNQLIIRIIKDFKKEDQ